MKNNFLTLLNNALSQTSPQSENSKNPAILKTPEGVTYYHRPNDLKGKMILLCDTNEKFREILSNYIHAWGGNCHTMHDMGEVIQELEKAEVKNNPYDIALLNYGINQISGIDIAKTIRKKTGFKTLKLILLAPAMSDLKEKKIKEAGFNAVIAKPIKQTKIYQILKNFVSDEGLIDLNKLRYGPAHEEKLTGSEFGVHLSILLVEDHSFNREVIKLNLERFGYHVTIAASGESAINQFHKKSFDLILMDIHMAGMDGNETARTIRNLEKKRLLKDHTSHPVPIIAMTADVTKESISESLAAGMNDFIGKPFTTDKLVKIISKITSGTSETIIEIQQHPSPKMDSKENYLKFISHNLKSIGIKNRETIARVIAKGKKSLLAIMQNMKRNIDEENVEELARDLHKLKGLLLNMGLNEYADQAKSIEVELKTDKPFSQTKANCHKIWKKIDKVIDQL